MTDNVWGDEPIMKDAPVGEDKAKPVKKVKAPVVPATESGYDMEGLMTDFPTAGELQKFVYDETGFSLNLKGRSNKLKYQIALDTLNGIEPEVQYLTTDNPYLDKNDLVPQEELKPVPDRDHRLPHRDDVQNSFHSRQVPHPDEECRAQDKYVEVTFRKYANGSISYEVLGPIEPRPVGEKIDKFGRTRPEYIKMVDPRTGEQLVQLPSGELTPAGKKLRALMQAFKVNNSNYWDTWIDREFISVDQAAILNPWAE